MIPNQIDRAKALLGKKQGKLTAINYTIQDGDTMIECKCDCGRTKLYRLAEFDRKDPKHRLVSCGECYGEDSIGKKYHHLTVLELIPSERDEDISNNRPDKSSNFTNKLDKSKYQGKRCRVQCDCGSEPFIWSLRDVRNDRKRQCDTFTCKFARRRKHNGVMANRDDNPAYSVWAGMHKRCYDPKHKSYPYYGALGIKVCDEWNRTNPDGLKNFTEWWTRNRYGFIGDETVDRIDSSKDYSPDNCRFASKSAQSANQKVRDIDRSITPYKCVSITYDGKFRVKIGFENRVFVCNQIPTAVDGLIIVCLFKNVGKFDFTPLSKFEYDLEYATEEETLKYGKYKLKRDHMYVKALDAARDPGYHFTVFKIIKDDTDNSKDHRIFKWKDTNDVYHYTEVKYPTVVVKRLRELVLLA